MATAYYADHGTTTQPAKSRTGVVVQTFKFTVPAVGFVLNDTVTLCNLPNGAKVLDYVVDVPDLDSNGAPTVKLDLGDSGAAQRYVAATTKGQSAAIIAHVNDGVAGSTNHAYTADDTLILKINTAPATTATSGTIQGWVMYEMDDSSI